MANGLRGLVSYVVWTCTVAVCLSARLDAAPQGQVSDPGYSVERVMAGIRRPSTVRLLIFGVPPLPVATFRVTIEQRAVMRPYKEHLQQELALTDLQHQSQEWSSKCCGVDLSSLAGSLSKALENRQIRKVRDQIARELALLEARKK